MESSEYALYIIIPLIVGFITEYYKNISTAKYAVFVFSIFVVLDFILYFQDGGSLLPSKFGAILVTCGVLFLAFLFHVQKVWRKQAAWPVWCSRCLKIRKKEK